MNSSLVSLDDIIFIVPKLVESLNVTLTIAFYSLVFGLLVGAFLTSMQNNRFYLVRRFAHYYIDIMRGAPLALLILLVFYGGKLILSRFASSLVIADQTFAILAISLSISGYFAEMMRSAYQAVDVGQKEAVQSTNIPPLIGFCRIIFPQCFILAVPNFCNLLINLVKMTSLVNIIGIVDVFGRAEKISQNSYGARQIPAFVSVIVVYWVLNLMIRFFTKYIEHRYQYLLK